MAMAVTSLFAPGLTRSGRPRANGVAAYETNLYTPFYQRSFPCVCVRSLSWQMMGLAFPHRIFTHLEDDSVLDAPLVEVILVPADVRLDLVDLSRRDRRQWC